MKKILILASIITISVMPVLATETSIRMQNVQKISVNNHSVMKPDVKRKAEFEKRLNLTPEQIQKANKLKKESREKIKPLMKQLVSKHNAIYYLNKSDISDAEKQKQSIKLKKEIANLDKKVKQIQTKNMKDFEKILTKEQKVELAKMKEEGRRDFAKNHPPKPFGYEMNRQNDLPDFGRGAFPPPPPPRD